MNLKITDLVKGEIYYHWCIKCKYIIRFDHLNGETIYGDAYIDIGSKIYGVEYSNITITELRKATPEESQWLLACINAGKFIDKEEALNKLDGIWVTPDKGVNKYQIKINGEYIDLIHVDGEKYTKHVTLNVAKSFIKNKSWIIIPNPVQEHKEWWKDLKKGDYVVAIKTSTACEKNFIYKVDNIGSNYWINHIQPYGNINGHNYNHYRKATDNEVAMYIDNNNSPCNVTTYKMKKNYKGKAVYITSQEQWDFVCSKYNYTWGYLKGDCISLIGTGTASKDYYISSNFKIISFQEWLDENGYIFPEKKDMKFEVGKWFPTLQEAEVYSKSITLPMVKDDNFKVGDWVVVTKQHGGNRAYEGYIGQLTKIESAIVPYEVDGSWCINVRKALPSEIPLKKGTIGYIGSDPVSNSDPGILWKGAGMIINNNKSPLFIGDLITTPESESLEKVIPILFDVPNI